MLARLMVLGGLLATALAWSLVSQAEGDVATQQSEMAQVVLQPIPEGKALVYLFNGSGRVLFGGGQKFKIDGRDVVELSRRKYSQLAMEPGPHEFRAAGEKLTIEVEAGQYYFVMYTYRPGKSWAGPFAGKASVLDQLTEEQARELLSEYEAVEIRQARDTA